MVRIIPWLKPGCPPPPPPPAAVTVMAALMALETAAVDAEDSEWRPPPPPPMPAPPPPRLVLPLLRSSLPLDSEPETEVSFLSSGKKQREKKVSYTPICWRLRTIHEVVKWSFGNMLSITDFSNWSGEHFACLPKLKGLVGCNPCPDQTFSLLLWKNYEYLIFLNKFSPSLHREPNPQVQFSTPHGQDLFLTN